MPTGNIFAAWSFKAMCFQRGYNLIITLESPKASYLHSKSGNEILRNIVPISYVYHDWNWDSFIDILWLNKITRIILIYSRDLDQIINDMRSPKHLQQHKDTKAPEDLPGLGRHYCIECAKWFESEDNMTRHTKGKNHKRRYIETTFCSFLQS